MYVLYIRHQVYSADNYVGCMNIKTFPDFTSYVGYNTILNTYLRTAF